MKTLTQHIKEDFKISQHTSVLSQFPTNTKQLKQIIDARYAKNPKHLDLRDIDVSKIRTFYLDKYNAFKDRQNGLFMNFNEVETIDIRGWNTSHVQNMSHMFGGCYKLTNIYGIEKIDVSHVKNMCAMFCWCTSLKEIDVSNWNTERVTDMQAMFGKSGITNIIGLNKLNVKKVKTMARMFSNCKMTDLDIEGWETYALTDIKEMFRMCKNLKNIYGISSIYTQKITSHDDAFKDVEINQDILWYYHLW